MKRAQTPARILTFVGLFIATTNVLAASPSLGAIGNVRFPTTTIDADIAARAMEAPHEGIDLKEADQVAATIRSCYWRGARDIHQMARCSGYLVNQDALAACVLHTPKVVCIPPKLCDRKAKDAPSDGHCVPWSAWLNESLSAEAAHLSRYGPLTIEQAVSGSAPSLPPLTALMPCDKPGTSTDRLRTCIGNAVQSALERDAIACVNAHKSDLIEIAINCATDKPLKLSPQETKLIRCAAAAANKSTAAGCLKQGEAAAIVASRAEGLMKCGLNSRDSMILGSCIKGLEITSPEGKKLLGTANCVSAKGTGTNSAGVVGLEDCVKKSIDPAKLQQAQASLDAINCAEKRGLGTTGLPCLPDVASLAKARADVDCAVQAKAAFDDKLMDCLAKTLDAKDKARVLCFAQYQNDPAALASRCVMPDGVKNIPPKVFECAARVAAANDGTIGATLARCNRTAAQALELQQKLAQCQSEYDAGRKADKPADELQHTLAFCIVGGQSMLPPAVACVMTAQSQSLLEFASSTCAKGLVSGDAARLASCYSESKGDTSLTALCMAHINLSKEQARLYACMNTAGGADERALCAAAPFVDQKTMKAAQCVVSNGGDVASSSACAAGIEFPGTKGMNNEWRTATQCAAASGGEPATATSCVATRLTFTELSKCITGGVGKPNGCFGPNNTIIVLARESWAIYGRIFKALDPKQVTNDLIHGWGKNNDARVALRNGEREVRTFIQKRIGIKW